MDQQININEVVSLGKGNTQASEMKHASINVNRAKAESATSMSTSAGVRRSLAAGTKSISQRESSAR